MNKRNQLKRDKTRGLCRIEIKVEQTVADTLNLMAGQQGMSRSELAQAILTEKLGNAAMYSRYKACAPRITGRHKVWQV